MKFTKYNVLMVSALVGVAIVGAQLSLKTMEARMIAPEESALALQAHKKVLEGKATFEQLFKLFQFEPKGTDYHYEKGTKALLAKLILPETLDEFRDHGTLDGRQFNFADINDWAIKYFKPAMAYLVFPYVTTQQLTGHTDWVRFVVFSSDGTHLASSSDDSTVRIWTLQPNGTYGQPQVLAGHTDVVLSVAFSPDGTRIASGSFYGTIRVWTLQRSGTYGQPQVLTGHTNQVLSVAFSPDGTHIASGSFDNTVRVWTQQNGIWQPQVLAGHTGQVSSVAFSPDGTHLASGSWDHTIRVWTLQTDGTYGQPQVLAGHTGSVLSVVFSSDGIHITSASDSWGDNVCVWTPQTDGTYGQPQVLDRFIIDSGSSAAFSPDGTHIASCSLDGIVSVRTLQTDSIYRRSQILTDHAHSVAFSFDGRLASGSNDGTVRVWTKIDLVGNDNVVNKIMLLQLLYRSGGAVLDRQHLRAIWWTFDIQARNYLMQRYAINSTLWDRAATAWSWVKSFVK